MMLTALILVAIVLRPPQDFAKIPVAIQCACDDANSRMLDSRVRDAIAASHRYSESTSKATDKYPIYHLVIVALDDTPSSMAVSVVVLRDNVFLTSAVRVCGIGKLDWCSASILSVADHAIRSDKSMN